MAGSRRSCKGKSGVHCHQRRSQRDLPSGIYRLDTDSALEPEWGGRELCTVLASHLSTPIYLIDPASRGECHPHARVTGTPAIQRTCSADHFLFKYLARQEAAKRDLRHSEGRFIVAHLDEVHQLGAVVGTKVVDCLSSADEGPFALYHSGGLPFDGVLELCSSHPQRQEVLKTLSVEGGLRGYLGLERLADLFTAQGEQAALVRDALVYQVAKEIGALAAVLAGQVDAIICGGELAKVEPVYGRASEASGFYCTNFRGSWQPGIGCFVGRCREDPGQRTHCQSKLKEC